MSGWSSAHVDEEQLQQSPPIIAEQFIPHAMSVQYTSLTLIEREKTAENVQQIDQNLSASINNSSEQQQHNSSSSKTPCAKQQKTRKYRRRVVEALSDARNRKWKRLLENRKIARNYREGAYILVQIAGTTLARLFDRIDGSAVALGCERCGSVFSLNNDPVRISSFHTPAVCEARHVKWRAELFAGLGEAKKANSTVLRNTNYNNVELVDESIDYNSTSTQTTVQENTENTSFDNNCNFINENITVSNSTHLLSPTKSYGISDHLEDQSLLIVTTNYDNANINLERDGSTVVSTSQSTKTIQQEIYTTSENTAINNIIHSINSGTYSTCNVDYFNTKNTVVSQNDSTTNWNDFDIIKDVTVNSILHSTFSDIVSTPVYNSNYNNFSEATVVNYSNASTNCYSNCSQNTSSEDTTGYSSQSSQCNVTFNNCGNGVTVEANAFAYKNKSNNVSSDNVINVNCSNLYNSQCHSSHLQSDTTTKKHVTDKLSEIVKQQGKSTQKIKALLNVNMRTIWDVLKRTRSGSLTAKRRRVLGKQKEVIKLRQQGKSTQQIHELLGVSKSMIFRTINFAMRDDDAILLDKNQKAVRHKTPKETLKNLNDQQRLEYSELPPDSNYNESSTSTASLDANASLPALETPTPDGRQIEKIEAKTIRKIVEFCAKKQLPLTNVDDGDWRRIARFFLDSAFDLFTAHNPNIAKECQKPMLDSLLPRYATIRAHIAANVEPLRVVFVTAARKAALAGALCISLSDVCTRRANCAMAVVYFISPITWKLEHHTMAPIPIDAHDNGWILLYKVGEQVFKSINLPMPAITEPTSVFSSGLVREADDEVEWIGGSNSQIPIRSQTPRTSTADKQRSESTRLAVAACGLHFVFEANDNSKFHIMVGKNLGSVSNADFATPCAAALLNSLHGNAMRNMQALLKRNAVESTQADNLSLTNDFNTLFYPMILSVNLLQNHSEPTLQKVQPLLLSWIEYLDGCSKRNSDSEVLRVVARDALADLRAQKRLCFDCDIFYMALILHPLRKNRIGDFLPNFGDRQMLKQKMVEAARLLSPRFASAVSESVADCSFFVDDDIEAEVIAYLHPSCEAPADVGILDFWRANETKFPNCARLARKILAIPATIDANLCVPTLMPRGCELDAETIKFESEPDRFSDLRTLLSFWP